MSWRGGSTGSAEREPAASGPGIASDLLTSQRVKLEVTLPAGALTVVAAPPMLVSQLTAEAVLGVSKRVFLAAAKAYRAAGGAVLSCGKLRLVRPDDFIAWLGLQTVDLSDRSGDADDDSVAARYGLRAADPGARGPARRT